MEKKRQLTYERNKEGIKISGDPADVAPLVKNDQLLQWVKEIPKIAIGVFAKFSGITAFGGWIRRIFSG